MKKMYFKRLVDNELLEWSKDEDHKPILLRGARQVGKSSSVKKLAEIFDHFIEINFEKDEEIICYLMPFKKQVSMSLCMK